MNSVRLLSPEQLPEAGSKMQPCLMWNLDLMLPMDLIRTHTKTDDIPQVTDEQLNLYRRTALEAAEQYTGFLLSGQKHITEEPRSARIRDRNRGFFTHTTQYPFATTEAYLFGSRNQGENRMLRVSPGSNTVRIPVLFDNINMENCCNPCSTSGINLGMQLMYTAGYKCASEVPAGIILGMLKYIAWNIMHPGDEIMTVRNSTTKETSGITGTNNTAWASGAIEQWRQYVNGAV